MFYYLYNSILQKLEKCILNVQVECLDINQSVKLTRTHSLFDGLISIWTRALQDYTTPLQELVPKIITTNGGTIKTVNRELSFFYIIFHLNF